METIHKTVDEFINYFEKSIETLIPHDFISQQQSKFFNKRKEELKDNELLAICDFSENYTFLIQDAIQKYHWVNEQCTIHPFALYWRDDDKLKMQSIVVIAESTKHDVTAVHMFQLKLFEYLKSNPVFNKINHIEFFSDGAGGQYKNKKNLYNISTYKSEYGFGVQWHCFATSHGKSACDGIGGSFKRELRREAIRRIDDPIKTAKEVFDWAIKRGGSNMLYIYCSNEEYKRAFEEDENGNRYAKVKTLSGTQSYHSFKPVAEGLIEVRRYSGSNECKTFSIIKE